MYYPVTNSGKENTSLINFQNCYQIPNSHHSPNQQFMTNNIQPIYQEQRNVQNEAYNNPEIQRVKSIAIHKYDIPNYRGSNVTYGTIINPISSSQPALRP
jgi:hypothetical protein